MASTLDFSKKKQIKKLSAVNSSKKKLSVSLWFCTIKFLKNPANHACFWHREHLFSGAITGKTRSGFATGDNERRSSEDVCAHSTTKHGYLGTSASVYRL